MPEWTRDTIWRQGHLLTEDAINELGLVPPDAQEQVLVIVVSHDCDLAQLPDGEPIIELVVGRAINKMDGNFTHAKTPRRLHIEFAGDKPLIAEFEANAKISIKKEMLAGFLPQSENHLTPENYSTFQYWLASRYRRASFPEEFERRLVHEAKLDEKISKAVRQHGALISGIFFDVDEGAEITRNDASDPYKLDIYILHTSEPDLKAAAIAAQQAATTIQNAFNEKLFKPTNTWRHIELRYCDVVSESVLTYAQFKLLKRWRLEYISLRATPQLPVLTD